MEINYLNKNILDKKYGRRSFLIGTSQLILVGLLIRQIRQIQLNESEKYRLLAEEIELILKSYPLCVGLSLIRKVQF